MSNHRTGPQAPAGLLSTIGLSLLGAVLGGAMGGEDELLFGLALGFLFARVRVERLYTQSVVAHLQTLGDRLDRLEQGAAAERAPAPGGVEAAAARERGDATAAERPATARPAAGDATATPAAAVPAPASARPAPPTTPSPPAPARPAPPPRRAPSGPTPVDRAVAALRELLFGGNTVVRGGILVLLVGVTLLARWAAERDLFPVEARLALAALIGLALTATGFRLREARPAFGTTLQGGGLAALYLVSFIAYRLFDLVPVGLAFGLFVVIAAAAGALAVLQHALALIVIASLGGFLAPILASTGSGNHVALFGYYLVLNASIAAIAFVRSWRVLNLLAFVCTYGVASVWGVLSYEPEKLASTLPFVFAFMLLFTGEALLFAWRQPPKLRGVVDGTLVFGTPLVSLIALARILSEVELGLALATSAMALLYAGVAVWLWRTAPDTLRQLAEAFVALGIGLATMAVPFAFEDSPTTAIIWALEGAGIHWIGVRQSRRLARASGLALQPLAAVAFAFSVAASGSEPADWWIANGRFLSTAALAFAGFAIAREADRGEPELQSPLWVLAQCAGVWGLGWWLFGSVSEISIFAPDDAVTAASIVVVGLTAPAMQASARALGWRTGRLVSLLLLPVAGWGLVAAIEIEPSVLAGGGWLAWPVALAGLYQVNRAVEALWPPFTQRAHAAWLWLVAVFAGAALLGLADHTLGLALDWRVASVGLGLVAVAAGTLAAAERRIDAFGRFERDVILLGAGPVVLASIAWGAVSHFVGEGATRPLPYLPILNPVDVVVALVVVTALRWWRSLWSIDAEEIFDDARPGIVVGAVLFGFAWLNAMLVRSVVQWAGVPHRAEPLWDSTPLQVCLSIAWALVGFAGMWLSTRRHLRKAWMAFAGLLGVTVIKLFVVDLSQLTTPAKIGTFLVVGVLLLVVGYLSPVPPDASGGDGPPPSGDGPGTRGPGEPQATGGGAMEAVEATEAERASSSAASASRALVWWLLAVPLSGLLSALPAHADEHEPPAPLRLEDFAWSRSITPGTGDVIQVVDLPFEVYRDSVEPGLADLRVFDADGEPVPFAVAAPVRPKPEEPTLTPLPLYRMPEGTSPEDVVGQGALYRVNVVHRAEDGYAVNVAQGFGRTTVELESAGGEASSRPAPIAYLVDTSTIEGEVVGLDFDLAPTDGDYLTALRIDATDDLVAYRPLRRKAVVAQLAGEAGTIVQRRVPLDRTRAKYMRITWPADEDAPVILGISAVQRAPAPARSRSAQRIEGTPVGPFSHEYDVGGLVPIDRIQLDLGRERAVYSVQLYRRRSPDDPWGRVFTGFVYQLGLDAGDGARQGGAGDDDEGRNPPISVDGRRTRHWRVDLDPKGAGAGRPSPALEIGWPTEQLYYVDQGRRPHVLAFGKAGAPMARVDASKLFAIAGGVERARGPRPATARLGERVSQRGRDALVVEEPFPVRKVLLWGVLLASVGLVATMALRLVREMNGAR